MILEIVVWEIFGVIIFFNVFKIVVLFVCLILRFFFFFGLVCVCGKKVCFVWGIVFIMIFFIFFFEKLGLVKMIIF